jgi:hypothetical protein
MARGVFLFFGMKDVRSLDIVKAITRTFQMPFVSPSLSRITSRAGSSYELHMKPSQTEAIFDVIGYHGWTKVHYLYDSDEGNLCVCVLNYM